MCRCCSGPGSRSVTVAVNGSSIRRSTRTQEIARRSSFLDPARANGTCIRFNEMKDSAQHEIPYEASSPTTNAKTWHQMTVSEVLKKVSVDQSQGLSDDAVKSRRA